MEVEASCRFGPLATAIAGRRLSVELVERLPHAFTDGAVVFAPDSLAADALRFAVAIQAALIAEGSFAPGIVGQLRHRHAPRYLALEGHRVCRELERRFPGLRAQIGSRVCATPITDCAAASLEWARGRRPVPAHHALFGSLELDALRRLEPEALPRPLEFRTDGDAADRKSRRSGLVDGALAEWTRRLLGLERGAGSATPGAKTGGHPFLPGEARAGAPEPGRHRAAFVSFASRRGDPDARLATRACRHPEFDVRRGAYRPDWCTVYEVAPGERARIGELRVADAELQHRLARVGLSLRRERRQREGSDLDLDAVVSRIVDLRANAASKVDEDVYVGLRRRARNFGVLILLDVSGSTADPSPSGRPVLEVQIDAAARLIGALSSLGVAVAAYAFRSHGRSAVRLERMLSFLEHSPAVGMERMLKLRAEGFTRLGAAVRHASTVVFDEAGTRERLLLVLSDGFAFDVDYEGEYAEADARRALEEARARGVACLCLSLGSSESDAALRRVFGSAAHASAVHFAQLLDRLPALLRQAMAEGRGRRTAA